MRLRRPFARLFVGLLAAVLATGALALSGEPVAEAAVTAATSVKVMPLGDSITGSPGCWRQVLWSRLQASGYTGVDFVGTLDNSRECGTNYDGGNEGHGGFLATNILRDNQLPGWLAGTRPDVVMMHLGTNDVWSNIPANSLLLTFSGLVDQMRASNPSMRILIAKIIPMSPSSCPECGQRVVALNNALPAWAAKTSTPTSPITVVDAWTGFSTASDTDDGVHPNASGNQKLAKTWFGPLTEVVDSFDDPRPTVTPTASSSVVPPVRTCSATMTVANAWSGGFVGSIKVTVGDLPISRWSVALDVPSGSAISGVWNGQRSGNSVGSVAWNSSLPPAGSVEVGFQATGSATGWSVASCTAS